MRELRHPYRSFAARIAACAAVAVLAAGCSRSLEGRSAPGLDLPDRTGKVVKISDLSGRPAMVYFWATWAPPSRLGMVQMVRLQAAFKKGDFSVVAVALGDDGKQVGRFLREVRVNFPVLAGTTGTAESWFGGDGPRLPTAFLLDRNGRVAEIFTGFQRKEDLVPSVEKEVAGVGK